GHLVKDRMQQAGMRWTVAGAQPMLDLRAVRLNDHWDAYWTFHRQQEHLRQYGAATVPDPIEDQALAAAASCPTTFGRTRFKPVQTSALSLGAASGCRPFAALA